MSNMARLTDEHRPVSTRTTDELQEVMDGELRPWTIAVDVARNEVTCRLIGGHAIAIHSGDVGAVAGVLKSKPCEVELRPESCVFQWVPWGEL